MTTPTAITAARVLVELKGHPNTTRHKITEIVREINNGKASAQTVGTIIDGMVHLGGLSTSRKDAGLYHVHPLPTRRITIDVCPATLVDDDLGGKYRGVRTLVEEITDRFGDCVEIKEESTDAEKLISGVVGGIL